MPNKPSKIDAFLNEVKKSEKAGLIESSQDMVNPGYTPKSYYKGFDEHGISTNPNVPIEELYTARDAAIKAERIETGKQVAQFFAVVLILALIGFGIWKFIQNPIKISNFKPKETTPNVADELLKLHELLEKKALTQEEFDTQKKKLLSK